MGVKLVRAIVSVELPILIQPREGERRFDLNIYLPSNINIRPSRKHLLKQDKRKKHVILQTLIKVSTFKAAQMARKVFMQQIYGEEKKLVQKTMLRPHGKALNQLKNTKLI